MNGDSSGSRRQTRPKKSNRSNARRREENEPNRYFFRPRYQPRYLCFLTDEKLHPRDTTFSQRKPTAQHRLAERLIRKGLIAKRKELGYMCLRSDEWPRAENEDSIPEYVFVSYASAQFCVVSDTEEMEDWKRPGSETPCTNTEKLRILVQSARDRRYLEFGLRAAREAKVAAFWIDFECLKPSNKESVAQENFRRG